MNRAICDVLDTFGWETLNEPALESEIHVPARVIKTKFPQYYEEDIFKNGGSPYYYVIKMPGQVKPDAACVNYEIVNRFTKLPIVESTLQTSKNIYDKVKDYNNLTKWTISNAEQTINKAVEVGKPYVGPMVNSLEGPMKKIDGLVCKSMDFVESKVSSMQMPPPNFFHQLYASAMDYIANTPSVLSACSSVMPTMDTAKKYVANAGTTVNETVQGAKSMVVPALESAKKMVHVMEPYIESSLEKASAFKEYGAQRLEEYIKSKSISATEEDEEQCKEIYWRK